MFDTIKRIREKKAQLLCGSAIILSLGISGCTTTGAPLLDSLASDTTLIENKTENSADVAAATPATGDAPAIPAAPTQTANAEQAPATPVQKPVKAEQAPAETAIAATAQILQDQNVTAAPKQPSTLAALFGTRSKPTAALAASEALAATQTETLAAPQQQAEIAKPEKPAVTPAPLTGPATDRTGQNAGAAARLFSSGKNNTTGSARGTQLAGITAAPARKTSEYNYTLPGVRANGGVEIRHSNKIFNEDDIDLDEDDFSATITLASAGGMARQGANGLRTQHAQVQVSCLKPQLVTMIKRLESHYRKPVIITSGYRSPSHNRKVSGAKRSLHMSCSAADLQIPGVSKWEIARHVRSLPGRGGVGTYCHTQSVHIDVGPERDWNWRCKR